LFGGRSAGGAGRSRLRLAGAGAGAAQCGAGAAYPGLFRALRARHRRARAAAGAGAQCAAPAAAPAAPLDQSGALPPPGGSHRAAAAPARALAQAAALGPHRGTRRSAGRCGAHRPQPGAGAARALRQYAGGAQHYRAGAGPARRRRACAAAGLARRPRRQHMECSADLCRGRAHQRRGRARLRQAPDRRKERAMAGPEIRFKDGAGYEQVMGRWSRTAGEIFLDWTAPPRGWRWLDVGCGNGAFTELRIERCAPAEVQGIDPSPAQLDFARKRAGAQLAQFQQGDAMALPFESARFDAATMALVIFFVPDPRKGVAEMARVVRPGGTVAAYAWNMPGGGFPYEAIRQEIAASGLTPVSPPSADASRIEAMQVLWQDA